MINFVHFMVFVLITIQRVITLNRFLKEFILSNTPRSSTTYFSLIIAMRKTSTIHKCLSLVVSSINHIFSISMVTYTILVSFVELSNIYKIIYWVIIPNHKKVDTFGENIPRSIFWCVYFVCKLVIIAGLCKRLKDAVSIIIVDVSFMVFEGKKATDLKKFFAYHFSRNM